jgi:hypothetical protein
MDYYRYVDDILIIYNVQKTNIMNTLDEFNAIHPKLKFSMEQQTQNRINYLYLTITKNQNEWRFGIYRNPLPQTSYYMIHHVTHVSTTNQPSISCSTRWIHMGSPKIIKVKKKNL